MGEAVADLVPVDDVASGGWPPEFDVCVRRSQAALETEQTCLQRHSCWRLYHGRNSGRRKWSLQPWTSERSSISSALHRNTDGLLCRLCPQEPVSLMDRPGGLSVADRIFGQNSLQSKEIEGKNIPG